MHLKSLSFVGLIALSGCADAPVFVFNGPDVATSDTTSDADDAHTDAAEDATGDVSTDAPTETGAGEDTATDAPADAAPDSSDASADVQTDTDRTDAPLDASPDAAAVCGNGRLEAGENCDDGNTIDETACEYSVRDCTGCSADCQTITRLVGGYCGNGVVDSPQENCDPALTYDCAEIDMVGTATCDACVLSYASCEEPAPEYAIRKNDGWTPGAGATFEAGFLEGDAIASCFRGTDRVVAIDVLFGGGSPGNSYFYEFVIYESGGRGVAPSAPSVRFTASLTSNSSALNRVELPSATTTSGDYCVSVNVTRNSLPSLAVDADGSATTGDAWARVGEDWYPNPEVGLDADWILRAVVEP